MVYDDDLLAVAGLRRDQLPELLGANAVLGPLTDSARAALGLASCVPVVAGTPDTMSAAVGSGAVADHAAHLYVGTSSWLSCHVPYKRTDPLRSVASLPSASNVVQFVLDPLWSRSSDHGGVTGFNVRKV